MACAREANIDNLTNILARNLHLYLQYSQVHVSISLEDVRITSDWYKFGDLLKLLRDYLSLQQDHARNE
jgi:hypothetical protein